jgi:hypothetical protein
LRPFLILLVLLGCYSRSESQTDSLALQHEWEITANVGRTLLDLGHDSNQEYIVRLGLGRLFEGFGMWHIYVEYERRSRRLRWGEIFPSTFEQEYPLHTVGAYLAWTGGSWFQLSLGGLMQFHGHMYYRSYWDTTRRVVPATSKTGLNAFVGMKTKINLGQGFAIPLAVDFDILPLFYLHEPVDLLFFVLTATPRIGISKQF